jgi:phosphoserine phosphatase RsbU/P
VRISTRLLLAAVVPAVVALVAVVGVLRSYSPIVDLQARQVAIIQLRTDLNELDGFARSYVANHDERSRQQFLAVDDQAQRDVATARSPGDPRYRQDLATIAEDLRLARVLFEAIVAEHQHASAPGSPLSREAEELLSTQLYVRSGDANNIAAGLVRSISANFVTTEQQTSLTVTALTIIAAAVLTVLLLVLRRSITRSLRKLQSGTEEIGSGDLDYRIGLSSSDELGDLGRSFDRMTERLQGVTVSKEELEEEVRQRRRAEERAQQELERTKLLQGVTAIAVSSLDLHEVGERVTRELEQRLGLVTATLMTADERRRELVAIAAAGYQIADYHAKLPPLSFDSDYESVRVYRSGEPLILGDIDAEGVSSASRKSLLTLTKTTGKPAKALLSLPLVAYHRTIGVLNVVWPEPQRFSPEDVAFFTSIGHEVAVGLENARLFEAEKRELARTALLNKVAIAGTGATSLPEVADTVLHALAESMDLKIGTVYSYSGGDRLLTLLASFGLEEGYVEKIRTFAVVEENPALVARAVLERRIVTSADVPMTVERRRMLEEAGITETQNVAAPVEAGGVVVGTLSLAFEREEAFSPDELEVFRSVAGILGQAIENARLFEEQRTRAERMTVLKDIAEISASSLAVSELAQQLVDAVPGLLGANQVAIFLEDPVAGALGVLASRGYAEETLQKISPPPPGSLSIQVQRTGKAEYVPDYQAADVSEQVKQLAREAAIGSVGLLPLLRGGRAVGVFTLSWPEPRTFDADERAFLESLAAEAAVGLDNARLYEGERDVADRLQEALLSLPDAISGIEFAHSYHSATEAARVGGDFYDLFELSHDYIGITIGDIAGKGLDAAVLTSMVKNTIRAHANERGKTPKAILELTNDLIYRSTATESFVTVFYGMLDRRDGRLVFGNAGHTTAALLHGDGSYGKLEVTGPLLGAFEDVEYDQAEVRMGYEELLFLYTDGLTEARRDGELYGEERLFAFLSARGDGSPADVVRDALADVISFSRNRLRDDLAVLALRRIEQGRETARQQKLEV